MAWLAEQVPRMSGTGIIYTLTKRDAEQVSGWLWENGISSAAYYSDVKNPDFESSDLYRRHLEDRLLNNDLKVLVSTTALGMGYDKSDLGFVIHYQAPDQSLHTISRSEGREGLFSMRAASCFPVGKMKRFMSISEIQLSRQKRLFEKF